MKDPVSQVVAATRLLHVIATMEVEALRTTYDIKREDDLADLDQAVYAYRDAIGTYDQEGDNGPA